MLLSSGHYRQDAASLWALQTGCCFPLGTTDRMLLSSGHYRQEVFFLWVLQTGSFGFLWALHKQEVLFSSGLFTNRGFCLPLGYPRTGSFTFSSALSSDRMLYVFLWAPSL